MLICFLIKWTEELSVNEGMQQKLPFCGRIKNSWSRNSDEDKKKKIRNKISEIWTKQEEDRLVAHSNRSASVYFYICPSVPTNTTSPAGSLSNVESIPARPIGLHLLCSHDTVCALSPGCRQHALHLSQQCTLLCTSEQIYWFLQEEALHSNTEPNF